MYEVRNQMDNLLKHQHEYHILKFIPRMTNRHDYRYHSAVLCALSSYKLAQWGAPAERLMQVAFAGRMYEVRNQMDNLLKHQHEYHILKFIPRMTNRHDYRYHSAVLCALSSYKLAQWVGLRRKIGCRLPLQDSHDIGNAKIDPIVLNKPSKLTEEENEEVRQHTTYGYQILKNVAASSAALSSIMRK